MPEKSGTGKFKGNDSDILRKLIDKCILLLEEVYRLTGVIDSAAKGDDLSDVESLFNMRGEEIKNLTDCESSLSEFLESSSEDFEKELIEGYSKKRLELFNKIQSIDSEIDKLIRRLRDEILVEMKELYKGKKMQSRYLNSSSAATGFIDIKE
ncbi:MAG: hypothetical protein GY863_13790 [bacterium]|nr:hypothetical protein [bacterium]